MITLILTIAIIGLLVYAVINLIPMPQIFRTIIIAIAVIFILLYLIRALQLDVPLR